jgi:hypothetical protein
MRGLFLKIFAIFWIAQSLIFVISTALILRHRPPNPEDLLDALSSSLRTVAKEGVAVFDTGGCDALQSYAAAHRDDIALEDTSERILCAVGAPPTCRRTWLSAKQDDDISGLYPFYPRLGNIISFSLALGRDRSPQPDIGNCCTSHSHN